MAYQHPSGRDKYNTSFPQDSFSDPPPPPAHQHQSSQPATQSQSTFQHFQDQRDSSPSPYQAGHSNARNMTTSPTSQRRPVGASLYQQPVSPIERTESPSPPMHFGMPQLPPPVSARTPYQGNSRTASPASPWRDRQSNDNQRGGLAGGAALGAGVAVGLGAAATTHNQNAMPHDRFDQHTPYSDHAEHGFDGGGSPYRQPMGMHSHESYGSDIPLATSAAYGQNFSTPTRSIADSSLYQDHIPNMSSSRSQDRMMTAAFVDPSAILDDGDDLPVSRKRSSRINIPFNKSKASVNASTPALGAGAIGDDMANGSERSLGGVYGPVPANRFGASGPEKSDWMSTHSKKKHNKWKKLIFIGIGFLIIAGIIAGAVSGALTRNKADNNSSSSSSSSTDSSPDLGLTSPEIKKLMNNANLHKVFSGFAYTPINTQYPACIRNAPIQNNVTKDMAVLSQLTNVVRLYGTDCNQTEMVLHAIDRLELTDMKVWLGVWLGNNATTNARQVSQMWTILDKYDAKYFKGIVMGNEVLFRKDLTLTQLSTYISETKQNLTAKGISLPVATSDLGDDWTAGLAQAADVVMANIHPFFGGVAIEKAADWTYNFWQTHDVALTAGMSGKSNIISEFGWPSAGGNDCGSGANCPDSTSGSVASIPNMNKLMEDWVCQALSNGTDYFWFEAFDEPWKIAYNEGKANWEDKWGLMDVNRNLKKGITIPSCGGKTAPS